MIIAWYGDTMTMQTNKIETLSFSSFSFHSPPQVSRNIFVNFAGINKNLYIFLSTEQKQTLIFLARHIVFSIENLCLCWDMSTYFFPFSKRFFFCFETFVIDTHLIWGWNLPFLLLNMLLTLLMLCDSFKRSISNMKCLLIESENIA